MYKEGAGDNGAQLVAKGFQEEVPSDSLTVDEDLLFIAIRNSMSLKLCDWQMQFMKVIVKLAILHVSHLHLQQYDWA